jgi:hypothetical protein
MATHTSNYTGFDRMLALSRHLTRGVETGHWQRTAARPALAVRAAAWAERLARANADRAWRELARHDRRMAQELRAALTRDGDR